MIVAVEIAARDWLDPNADLLAFDRLISRAEREGEVQLIVSGARDERRIARAQCALRYQRIMGQTNEMSSSAFFSSVLSFLRSAHARAKDTYDHATDVWQWVLRGNPGANLALQLAALFHEERGHMVRAILRRLEAWPILVERVALLVEKSVRLGGESDLVQLAEADSLSFFGRGSAKFLAENGEAETARVVDDHLARLRAPARAQLAAIKHPREVERMIRTFQPLIQPRFRLPCS